MISISLKNNKWWVLASVIMAMSMIFTDQNIIPVTLPTIQKQFNSSDVQVQWIVNAYYLSMAVLMLLGGKIADIFGHRRIFCIGIVVFVFFALFCSAAMNIQWLIVGRVFQGAGAALLMPTIFSLIVDNFPDNQRGFAVGLNTSISSLFLTMMPFVGGYFTQYLSWRLVFLVHIPIATVGMILSLLVIPKSERKQNHFDYWGFTFFSLAFISLTLAVMQGKNWGWSSLSIISLFVLSILFFIGLYVSYKKVKEPFIDFTLFKKEFFLGGAIGLFFVQFILMMTVFWPIYFQDILGFSPTKAGLVMMISFFPMLIMSPIGGKLLDKFGPKVPVFIGCALVAFSYIWFSIFINKRSIIILLPSFLTVGWGVTFAMTATVASAVSSSNEEKRGAASGITGMLRTSGRSFGLAILGAIYVNMKIIKFGKLLDENDATKNLNPDVLKGLIIKTKNAQDLLKDLPMQAIEYVKTNLYLSIRESFITINLTAAGIAITILVTYLFLTRNKKASN